MSDSAILVGAVASSPRVVPFWEAMIEHFRAQNIGIEYALGLDDADVRLGLHVTGGLTGPADPEIAGLKGYVLGTAGIGIGF